MTPTSSPTGAGAQEIFDAVLAQVAEWLNGLGFKRSGITFRKVVGERMQVIVFRKSVRNVRRSTYMTFYVGISLVIPLLARVNYPDWAKTRVTDSDGILKIRVRDPQRDRDDWLIKSGDGAQEISARVGTEIRQAIRQLETFPSDSDVLDGLLAGTLRPQGSEILAAKMALALSVKFADESKQRRAERLLREAAQNVSNFDVEAYIRTVRALV